MTHKQNFKIYIIIIIKKKKTQNKVETYIPGIVWIVGLIKSSTMDFKNIKIA